MDKMKLDDYVISVFQPQKKCIINADLDGLLAGMLLQSFLSWDVVGYSSCTGSKDKEELWLYDKNEKIEDCVFVDLPVFRQEITVIDNHFVSLNEDFVHAYRSHQNKVNPNVMRELSLNKKQYNQKYPFGTTHLVLAILENLGVIKEGELPNDFINQVPCFDNVLLADLFYRADDVIGNFVKYNENVRNWSEWLIKIGGNYTKKLFNNLSNRELNKEECKKMMKDYENNDSNVVQHPRLYAKKEVEEKLKSFGLEKDGDCSKLFRNKQYYEINNFLLHLSYWFRLAALRPVDNRLEKYGQLYGERIETKDINDKNWIFNIEQKCNSKNVFSYAFTFAKTLSMTYRKDNDDSIIN